MAACVFCNIVQGKAPASKVFEDEHTLAFMDLRQFHPGHVLVIPKPHLPDVRDLDETLGAALMRTVMKVSRAVGAAFPSDGMNLWHSVGAAGGQEVFHLHIHVLPRFEGDGLLQVYPETPGYPEQATLNAWAERINHQLQPEKLL